MQLINITSTPIEYKINIEAARLEMKQSDNPRYQMTQNQGRMNIDAKISRCGWIPPACGKV